MASFLPRAFAAENACFDDEVPCATGWRETSPGSESVFCAAVAFAREVVGCSSTSFCQLCCGKNHYEIKFTLDFKFLLSERKLEIEQQHNLAYHRLTADANFQLPRMSAVVLNVRHLRKLVFTSLK